jgi:FkbM family methyltransferase
MRVGRFLYLGARRELINEPLLNGEYKLIEWVLATTKDQPAVRLVDVGANLGFWSKRALAVATQMVSTKAVSLFAFEPAHEQRTALALALDPYHKNAEVKIIDNAVAAKKGKMRFLVTGSMSGNSSLIPDQQFDRNRKDSSTIEVLVTSLDHQFCDAGEMLDLIKVDTEGNDFNVILGSQKLLASGAIKVLQFEYNWRWIAFGHSLNNVFTFIADKPYAVGVLTNGCIELHATWHPELDRFIETNYVLVRKDMIAMLPCRHMAFSNANTIVAA